MNDHFERAVGIACVRSSAPPPSPDIIARTLGGIRFDEGGLPIAEAEGKVESRSLSQPFTALQPLQRE
jgi:hypothetical protein